VTAGRASEGMRSARRRRAVRIASVALGLSMALTACGSATSVTTATSTSTTSTSSATSTPTSVSTTAPSAGLGPHLPLFPFSNIRQVASWQDSYRSGGHQPWHLDPAQSALAFAAWLGFVQIDTVIATHADATGAHVSIGFHTGGPGNATSTSAVVHLVRWGTGADIPWEVVGTDDTTFTLNAPAYGTSVTSPITVGGRISGVDENIKVQVRTSSAVAGSFCCVPAGGTSSPWSATVSVSATTGTVLTIAAQTGGHVAAVERFTVTGVRAG
jgi:hypothetical protein